MKFALAFLLLIFFASFHVNADSEEIIDYRKKINLFFSDLDKGNATTAVEKLLLGVPSSESRAQGKVKFSIGIEDIIKSEGSYKGYDILFEKMVTPNIVYLYSFGYFEKSPVRFEFIFRKYDGDWTLAHMDISIDAPKEIRYAIVNKLVR